MNEVSPELIKIFNTPMHNEDILSHVNFLQKSNVLTSKENEICKKILEHIELTSKVDLCQIIKELLTEEEQNTLDVGNIGQYESSKLTEIVDNFIKTRKDAQTADILKKSLEEMNNSVRREVTDFFFDRYADIIDIKEDDSYSKLEKIENDELDVSTGIKDIDDYLTGLQNGTITTILGTEDTFKSMWALNIAYKALTEGKNVLYLTPSDTKETIYKRFITRHSCDINQFDRRFRFDGEHVELDNDNYKIIYNNFKMSLLDYLIVFDESEFLISTYHNLQKLIVYAENKFKEKTGNGISLIIIDDFTEMKLDVGRRQVTNQSTIINEYYKYLRSQSRNFLGTNRKIPIVITFCNLYVDIFHVGTIPREIKILSDNVFSVMANGSYGLSKTLSYTILQSYKSKSYKETKSTSVDCDYWYIKYDEGTIDKSLEEQLEEKNQEIARLGLSLEQSKRTINSLTEVKDENINQSLSLDNDIVF